jgi:hypothetical protein
VAQSSCSSKDAADGFIKPNGPGVDDAFWKLLVDLKPSLRKSKQQGEHLDIWLLAGGLNYLLFFVLPGMAVPTFCVYIYICIIHIHRYTNVHCMYDMDIYTYTHMYKYVIPTYIIYTYITPTYSIFTHSIFTYSIFTYSIFTYHVYIYIYVYI